MNPLIISDEIEEEFWQPGCFTVVKQSVGDTVLPVHGRDAHVKNHISQTQGHDDQVSLDGSIPYHITVKAPAFLNGNAVFFQVFLHAVEVFPALLRPLQDYRKVT